MRGTKYTAIALLLGAIAFNGLALPTASAAAADPAAKVPVTIGAGETYVIKGLDSTATPAIRVVQNPHALVVGAEAGEWQIKTTRSDGQTVTYDIAISGVGSPISHPLKPSTAPPAMSDMGLTGSDAKSAPPSPLSAPGALDRGSGPIKTSSATTASAAGSIAPPAASAAASSSTLVPVAAPAPPPASAMSAPMPSSPLPMMAEAAPSVPASGAAPSGVMATQSSALQAPPEKFHTDPLAGPPIAPTEAPNGVSRRSYLPDYGIDLMADTSEIYDFPTRITRVSIADSNIADIQVINPFQINLVGHQPGFTTLAVWDAQGHYLQRQVRVDRDGKEQVLLNVIVAELNRSRIEDQGTNFAVALTHLGLSLVSLPGQVATPFSPQSQIITQATAGVGAVATSPPPGTIPPGGQLTNMLLSQNITYAVAGQNNNVNSAAFFQYLEQHQLAKVLAEPHLLANSGEKAQFLSGGEIPIVIAQALNTSIVFKQFGTSVVFVPTVVGGNDIELAVKPEVSAPDYAHGVQLFGFTVPAFITRRAETFVRLHNLQTLIIAGLILDNKIEQVNKVPYLGDIPYLGGLARKTEYTDNKTDLVMSVTPQIVTPLPDNGQVALPVDRGPLTREEVRTERVYPPDASRPRF